MGTIKSTGETITSAASAGTKFSAASVGTADTVNAQTKEIMSLKLQLKHLQEDTVDILQQSAEFHKGNFVTPPIVPASPGDPACPAHSAQPNPPKTA